MAYQIRKHINVFVNYSKCFWFYRYIYVLLCGITSANFCAYLFQFLERCTSLLDLPFAARRLFDESGKEHFSLVNLSRDQLIYVSCGEAWSDPTLSKAEQQRRFLLSNLASDVSQIRHFVNLRHADSMYSKKLFSIFL